MRDASTAFAALMTGSHRMSTRVDVLFAREVVEQGIPVDDGRIRYNRNAARLASLSCSIADEYRIPTTSSDLLTPYGYELRVWRGVPDELLPVGTFPIQRSSVSAVAGVTQVAAHDRSQLVSDARFEDVYVVAAGGNYADEIEALISDGVDGLEYLFPTVAFVTPLLVFSAQSDRWEAAQQMARAIGHEILFDGLGRCVMRPEPTFGTTPQLVYADALNLVDLVVDLDRGPAYNRVIATSANASLGAQYRGVATDDDPSSPTFYDGPFGRKPRFYASEFIASDDQATSAAGAILAANLGVAKRVEMIAVPDPRAECSDVIQITNSRLAVDALHIIDTMVLGLGPRSPLTAGTRSQEGTVTT